jgi:hypothetical protein
MSSAELSTRSASSTLAWHQQHLCGFRERPVARELLAWKPISHRGQAIVSAIKGIDNGLRIPARGMIIFSKSCGLMHRQRIYL